MAKPIPTPFKRSVATTAITVATKGMNWNFPKCQKCLNVAGFASLYPTKINTAANVANGIKFRIIGIESTQINNKTP